MGKINELNRTLSTINRVQQEYEHSCRRGFGLKHYFAEVTRLLGNRLAETRMRNPWPKPLTSALDATETARRVEAVAAKR